MKNIERAGKAFEGCSLICAQYPKWESKYVVALQVSSAIAEGSRRILAPTRPTPPTAWKLYPADVCRMVRKHFPCTLLLVSPSASLSISFLMAKFPSLLAVYLLGFPLSGDYPGQTAIHAEYEQNPRPGSQTPLLFLSSFAYCVVED